MNLLFLGHSLIEYFDWQERFPAHNAVNLGVAGETVEGLLARVLKIKDVCPEADMIFIMTGINNVAMGDTGFFETYRVILEKLSSYYPGAKVFVHSILPVRVDFMTNEPVREANVRLKELSEASGVEYLDIYSKFVDAGGEPVREYLLDDGVHLTARGYAVWSEVLEEIINPPG
ncbi:MAG: GDSL family lipase [Deferribacteres bacterium]|nr:GDSL family lipase [Deferribacteres bacterium]